MEQPIVSRTFDVWSLSSESYFWEIKYAIESKNTVLFENVLDKYNIDYLIYDKTLNPVSSVEEGLQYDQIDEILGKTQKVVRIQSFEELDILMVNHDHNINDFVSIVSGIPTVSPEIKVTNLDQAYAQLGDYKVSTVIDVDQPDYVYPFLDLTTQTNVFDRKWDITEDDTYFYFKADLGNYDLNEYNLEENPTSKSAKVFLGQTVVDYNYIIEEYWEGSTFVIKVGKELVESFDPTYVNVNNCGQTGSFGVAKRGTILNVESVDRGIACFGYASGLLDHWNGYMVKLNSENLTGKELFFYIFGNKTRKQSKLETNLKGGVEYFLLNPGYYYDDGYYFSFQNSSYKAIPSENNLLLLDVYLLPFEYLKNVRFVKHDLQEIQSGVFENHFNSEKDRYYAYKLIDRNYVGQNIVLYQSFDAGWGAYIVDQNSYWEQSLPFFFGKRVSEHFKVNNWANGWTIPEMGDNEYLLLFFWPQMLEYIGIVALVFVWNLALLGAFLRTRAVKTLNQNQE